MTTPIIPGPKPTPTNPSAVAASSSGTRATITGKDIAKHSSKVSNKPANIRDDLGKNKGFDTKGIGTEENIFKLIPLDSKGNIVKDSILVFELPPARRSYTDRQGQQVPGISAGMTMRTGLNLAKIPIPGARPHVQNMGIAFQTMEWVGAFVGFDTTTGLSTSSIENAVSKSHSLTDLFYSGRDVIVSLEGSGIAFDLNIRYRGKFKAIRRVIATEDRVYYQVSIMVTNRAERVPGYFVKDIYSPIANLKDLAIINSETASVVGKALETESVKSVVGSDKASSIPIPYIEASAYSGPPAPGSIPSIKPSPSPLSPKAIPIEKPTAAPTPKEVVKRLISTVENPIPTSEDIINSITAFGDPKAKPFQPRLSLALPPPTGPTQPGAIVSALNKANKVNNIIVDQLTGQFLEKPPAFENNSGEYIEDFYVEVNISGSPTVYSTATKFTKDEAVNVAGIIVKKYLADSPSKVVVNSQFIMGIQKFVSSNNEKLTPIERELLTITMELANKGDLHLVEDSAIPEEYPLHRPGFTFYPNRHAHNTEFASVTNFSKEVDTLIAEIRKNTTLVTLENPDLIRNNIKERPFLTKENIDKIKELYERRNEEYNKLQAILHKENIFSYKDKDDITIRFKKSIEDLDSLYASLNSNKIKEIPDQRNFYNRK